jgi:hypothetical protein
MSDYLIVADSVSPLAEGDAAAGALGLASAFASAGHRVAVLSAAAPEVAAKQPGLARRLRSVTAAVGGHPLEVPLFEGRPTSSAAHLFILGAALGEHRGRKAALFASAAARLAQDGLYNLETVIGWGETSASTLLGFPAARRLFVLPEGTAGGPLPPEEVEALAEADDLGAGRSLLARGIMASDALVVPSPAAARALGQLPELTARASDQPIVVVRLGCDEPPFDPAGDPALAAAYSAEAPQGKAECRKMLGKKLSLALGPRTLLVTTPPLDARRGGRTLLTALSQLTGLDVAVAVQAGPDRLLAEQAKVLAIEFPGRIALAQDGGPAVARELLAGADAIAFADAGELTARPAGLALRYGALPIAPEAGAFGDYLVDCDPSSGTGNSLLYAPGDAFELGGAIRRAIALRSDAPGWPRLQSLLLRSAPSWTQAAALLESTREPEPEVAAAAV